MEMKNQDKIDELRVENEELKEELGDKGNDEFPKVTDDQIKALSMIMAKFKRQFFDALVEEGFSRKEALQIVSGGIQ